MSGKQLGARKRELWLALAVLWLAVFAAAAPTLLNAQGANNIAVRLSVAPADSRGQANAVLAFDPAPGWHGYWSNPGDAGYGMQLDWRLPPGWSAGEPLYPVPKRLLIAGLMNHVYEGRYAVVVPLTGPPGAAVPALGVEARWLACTDTICVPEQAQLSAAEATLDAGQLAAAQAAIAPPLDRPARFAIDGNTLRLAIPLPADLALPDPHIFVGTGEIAQYAAAQRFFRQGDLLIAEILTSTAGTGAALPAVLDGIAAFGPAGEGVRFTAEPGSVPRGGTPLAVGGPALPPLWTLLLGALVGGLLLNIMPCVFPILSLKALTLARAGGSEAEARREGVAYAAGAVIACLALGGVLLALRAAGEQVGWAFQLQEPLVVAALLVLAAAITANLAGLFALPQLAVGGAGRGQGAFATGLLAAFVATPCTGPFMAAAMGAALLLPVPQALLLFGVLGLGLALPFLLLGFVPRLRAMLPRPGPWMERFRRWMALPMGLTALALLWLAARLGGPWFAAFAAAVAAALIAALALWQRGREGGDRRFTLAAGIAAAFAVIGAANLPYRVGGPAAASAQVLPAEPFSEAALAAARASGRPVFVWFTADWCVTCKVNESVAIEREATRTAFAKANVAVLRGDWTRRDPAITRFLTGQGAAGVPLYLWYPAGGGAPRQLPQLLTPEALTELAVAAPVQR